MKWRVNSGVREVLFRVTVLGGQVDTHLKKKEMCQRDLKVDTEVWTHPTAAKELLL